jgi:hypothetical protein
MSKQTLCLPEACVTTKGGETKRGCAQREIHPSEMRRCTSAEMIIESDKVKLRGGRRVTGGVVRKKIDAP